MRKMFLYIALIFVFLVLVESCKMGPNYQGVEVQPPDTYYFSESQDSLGDLRWWDLFNDPVLDSLIRLSLINNQNILIATQNVAQTQAILNIQKAEMYPKFGLQADGGYGNFMGFRADDPTGSYSAGANLKWEIDFCPG